MNATAMWMVPLCFLLVGGRADAYNMGGEQNALPPGHPPVSGSARSGSATDGAPLLAGVIEETIDTGNYTYVRVNTGEGSMWAATERFEAVVGSHVVVPRGMVVKNFESPTLNRTFAELVFADSIELAGNDAAPMAGHAAAPVPASPAEQVAPAEGGLSVADVYRRRDELAGSTVTVRGRVTKYTERVMGRNWLHVEDGSAEGAVRDLTISTPDRARLGDLVTVTGAVAVNEDLGHGYFYEVMVKDAAVAREE